MIHSARLEQRVLYVKILVKYTYVTFLNRLVAVLHPNQAEFSQKSLIIKKHACFYGEFNDTLGCQ